MSEKKNPDPFPQLGRRSLFCNAKPTETIIDIDIPGLTAGNVLTLIDGGPGNNVFVVVDDKASRSEREKAVTKAKQVLIEAELKRPRGRPKSTKTKPWEEEMISKASWYRRKKDKRDE
jgi:hypothetical protein